MSKFQSLRYKDNGLTVKLALKLDLFFFGAEVCINIALTSSRHISATFDVKMATAQAGLQNRDC